jgi:hypothetical protein
VVYVTDIHSGVSPNLTQQDFIALFPNVTTLQLEWHESSQTAELQFLAGRILPDGLVRNLKHVNWSLDTSTKPLLWMDSGLGISLDTDSWPTWSKSIYK